jgi:hypothetical protein
LREGIEALQRAAATKKPRKRAPAIHSSYAPKWIS